MNNKFEKSKSWNMFVEDNKLFITKGADEIYYLDEVKEEQVSVINEAYNRNSFDSLIDNISFRDILVKLEQAGVIYQRKFSSSKNKIKIFFKYFGIPNDQLKKELDSIVIKRKNIIIVDKVENCDLFLLIRINTPLKNLLEDYANIDVPHLFIDLGYANTISIGPLVYKRETACLCCFIGKIIKNWGDLEPPVEPDITNKYELITSFILERIEEYINYGNCPDLVNGVWNFNTKTFTSGYDKVYKSPWCPMCAEKCENPKIELPWIDEVNHE